MPPIGGQLMGSFGGCLGFLPYQGNLPAAGTPPPIGGRQLLDVERWELLRHSAIDDTTHTGSYGAEGNDVTCIGFHAVAEVLWDLFNPPNFVAQFGGLITGPLVNNYGTRLWLYVGGGTTVPASLGPYYYFAPSAKAAVVQTIINAGGKQVVRARIDIIGNSHIFSFGGSLHDQAQYDAYIAHCAGRGWRW